MNQDQINGILSGWNKIEADLRVGLHEDFGKSKDLQDILDIIHGLQETAHTVSPLRELFTQHLTDTQNPHQVKVSIGDLDLLNTMYNLYMMKYGMDMTFSEFGYALVNIKRFATKADVENNTNLDSIVNLDVTNFLMERHNTSPEAHADLFRYKLPGVPLRVPPVDVFEPTIVVSNLLNVERGCPINYHDINGRVKEAPENTLPIDYSYGRAACPIFGPHRNVLLNSRILTDVSHYGSVRNNNRDLFVVTPIDDTNFLLLQETVGLGAHGFFDPITEELTDVNNYSIYAYPLERRRFSISIMSGSTVLATGIFDCDLKQTQSNGAQPLHTSIQDLPNNWYRCIIAFNATNKNITGFRINLLKNDDDIGNYNETYEGVVCNAMGFWQHQITKTVLPTPPIFTDNTPVAVLGTKVRRNFTNMFNPIRGSLVIRYLSPMSERFGTPSTLLRMGHNGPNPTSAIRIRSNEINPQRNRIISYNMNNEILEMIDSEPYDPNNPKFLKRVVFTYGLGYHGFGFIDQHPEVFPSSIDSAVNQMMTFFTHIYNGITDRGKVLIIQVPQDVITDNDTDETLVVGELANTAQYRINMFVDTVELGYDSTTDTYLDGYLINFRYYSVFSSNMNIEFLLDQYLPKP